MSIHSQRMNEIKLRNRFLLTSVEAYFKNPIICKNSCGGKMNITIFFQISMVVHSGYKKQAFYLLGMSAVNSSINSSCESN